ncbi:MAG: HEAT repeat domain-containing protein [Pirellulaceae bacterium]
MQPRRLNMQYFCRSRWLRWGLAVWPWFATGCAEGPFSGAMASMSPWVRKKWEEDEKFGPTYYRRIADLKALRTAAPRLEPARQEQLAAEMAQLVQTDPNAMIRSEAVAVLGTLKGPAAIAALNAAVTDADRDVRIAACRAWGRVHSTDAVSVLSQVAEADADLDVRLVAIGELGTFQDPTVVQALGKALDDSDPAVQFRAVQSLKSSTQRDLGDSVPAWREFVQGKEPASDQTPSMVQRLYEWF